MNGGRLTEAQALINVLKDKDASSSLMPLLIVVGFLVCVNCFALYKIFSHLRLSKHSLSPLKNPWTLFKALFMESTFHEEISQSIVDYEAKNSSLEAMLLKERDSHKVASLRVAELEAELAALLQAAEESRMNLEIEYHRRVKLERQLKEMGERLDKALNETERIYEQSDLKVVESTEEAPPTSEVTPTAGFNESDLERMKIVLEKAKKKLAA